MMTFNIPFILKLPHAMTHEQLAHITNIVIESGCVGKVPSHLCKAIAQLPILSPCYRDENFRYYALDAWYTLACQLTYAKGEFRIASKRALYNHIKTLKELGILVSDEFAPSEQLEQEVALAAKLQPTQWLRISSPDIAKISPKATKPSVKRKKVEHQLPNCMTIDDNDLMHGGSLHITARLLNHVVNISSRPCFENIAGEVTIRDAQSQRIGVVWLRASSPRHLPVMDASHLVLVNVIYKLIVYRLASLFSDGNLQADYQNLFGFSKAMLAKYLGKVDGGETRKYFDAVMEIITATRFEIHDKNGAAWFFQKLGLTDNQGQPFTKATLQLLVGAGELNNAGGQVYDHSPSHIYVRMAPHLDDAIRMALKQHESKTKALEPHDFHSLLQYPRQRTLFTQNSGILQLLTDYFAYRLVSPGAFYVSDLSALLPRINYSIKSSASMQNVIGETFKTLMHSNNILATHDVQINSRNQIRLTRLIAIINDRYLIRIQASNHHTQLSKRTYQFCVLHVNKSQHAVVKQRQQFLLEHMIKHKQSSMEIALAAHVTQEDLLDSSTLTSHVEQWLSPLLKSNIFMGKRQAS